MWMARNSAPRLRTEYEANAVARFADYIGDDAEGLRTAATADADPHEYPRQLGRDSQRDGARVGDEVNKPQHIDGARKSLRPADLCNEAQSNATCRDKATERTRTVDLRFTKPLLYQLSYGGKHLCCNKLRLWSTYQYPRTTTLTTTTQ